MSHSIRQKKNLYTGLIKQTFINKIDNVCTYYKDEGGKNNFMVLNLKNKYKYNITGNIEILLNNYSFKDNNNIISYCVSDEVKQKDITYKLLDNEKINSNNIQQTPILSNFKPEVKIAINNQFVFNIDSKKSKLIFIRINKVSKRKDNGFYKIKLSYNINERKYYEETDEIVVKSKRKIPAKLRYNEEAIRIINKKRKLNNKKNSDNLLLQKLVDIATENNIILKKIFQNLPTTNHETIPSNVKEEEEEIDYESIERPNVKEEEEEIDFASIGKPNFQLSDNFFNF